MGMSTQQHGHMSMQHISIAFDIRVTSQRLASPSGTECAGDLGAVYVTNRTMQHTASRF